MCAQQDVGLDIRHRLERNQLVGSVALTAAPKGGNLVSRSVATVLPLETGTLRSPMDWP